MWIYEVDLDRNIFHINGRPFFALECLSNDDDFLQYIADDHDGGVVCAPECPSEHKYNTPAPPVVNRSDLMTYRSLTCKGTDVALNDLLSINNFWRGSSGLIVRDDGRAVLGMGKARHCPDNPWTRART
jgi:hypothetical protein